MFNAYKGQRDETEKVQMYMDQRRKNQFYKEHKGKLLLRIIWDQIVVD